jgi:carbon-monoxide dehydrogenase small subunit
MERTISFTLNGKPASVKADDERMLLWVLRSDLGLTGTKFGCGEALCGACTVMVNEQAVRSCSTPFKDVAGARVLTIEGLGQDGLHAIQQAFVKHHAFQCGFCTPGMIMNAYALLLKTPQPTHEQIISHMDDNLCRCGAHVRIVDAIQEAAGAAQGGA